MYNYDKIYDNFPKIENLKKSRIVNSSTVSCYSDFVMSAAEAARLEAKAAEFDHLKAIFGKVANDGLAARIEAKATTVDKAKEAEILAARLEAARIEAEAKAGLLKAEAKAAALRRSALALRKAARLEAGP